MKKFFVLVLFCVSLLVSAAPALAAAWSADDSDIIHESSAHMIQNKAIYDRAYFERMVIYFEQTRAETEADKTTTGSLTIKNGSFNYYAPDWMNVNNEDATFQLKYASGDSTYVEFGPYSGDHYIGFRGQADGGLQKKTFTWKLSDDVEISEVIPDFATTVSQMSSRVPYVERDSDKKKYTFRIAAAPTSTSTPVAIPFNGRYRVRFQSYNPSVGYSTVESVNWVSKNAGETFEGTHTLGDGINPEDISRIRIDAQINEAANADRHYYRWYFYVFHESNEGLVSAAPIENAIYLASGEEKNFELEFNSGYETFFGNFADNLLIDDESIVIAPLIGYDSVANTFDFTLQGLKKGETTLYLTYYGGNDSKRYNTIPIKVYVDSGGGSGGSSGCSASGFGFAVALTAGAFLLKRKNER